MGLPKPPPPPAAGGAAPASGATSPPPSTSTSPSKPASAKPSGETAAKPAGAPAAKPAAAKPAAAKPGAAAAKPGATKPASGATKPGGTEHASSKPAAAAKPAAGAKATQPKGVKPPSAAAGGPAKAGQSAKARPRTGPTREERLAAAQAARRRQSIRNRALLAGGVAAIVAVVGFVVVSDRRERSRQASQFDTASCDFDRRSDSDSGTNRNHVPNPTYEVNPPSGGNHLAVPAAPGLYTAETVPADGAIVHALEHGYIVLWHRPDLDEQSLAAIRDLAQNHAGEVLMVPRPSLEVPVAATAWHVRLLCGAVETETLDRFTNTFVDKGPESGFVEQTRQAR